LESLAAHTKLPAGFLQQSVGLHPLNRGRHVGVPYHGLTGELLDTKIRTHVLAGRGYKPPGGWPEGRPLQADGLWKLQRDAQGHRFMIFVEGESDCWTLWFHDFPAYGVPGNTAAKVVEKEHLESLQAIYLLHEPDQGGDTSIKKLLEKLVELGFAGKVFELKMPDDVKDPAELHRADPDQFKRRFQDCLDAAQELKLHTHAESITAAEWPQPLQAAAFHELAGKLVRAIEPHSEADPVALLLQTLVAFGDSIGRTAHFIAEGDRHYTNLFAVMVGRTAKGRKGSSWGRIVRAWGQVDGAWVDQRILGGLSSGEGLIWQVRDPIIAHEKVKEHGRVIAIQEYEADPGVSDKRLMIYEPEFAVVLKVIERHGNTLSAIIRQAWETGSLRTLTKNSQARATDAHVSIIGHATADELLRYLSVTEAASGFGNRFLWACVRRSKFLPEGGGVELDAIAEELKGAVTFARQVGTMQRDGEARAIWHQVYNELSAERPALAGALLGRAEAQVMRLACIYALLDRSSVVNADHLKAALALWRYCEDSTRFVFGSLLGDAIADEILNALRLRPREGMTRTEIRSLFDGHRSSERISAALALRQRHGLARCQSEATGGRPIERWIVV
jgi:hypothetical protein